MWKAIGWGFAGLVLGVIVGGAVGAVLGTLAGSAGGVLHWGLHHGEHAVCKARAPVRVPVRALGAVAAAAVVVWAASAMAAFVALPFLLEMAAAAALIGALGWVLRYGGWRKPRPVRVAVRTVAPRALKAPPRAIGGRPVVTATVLASDYERQAVR